MKRFAIFVYGLACYVVFLATFLYAIGFIGNFATPTTLDGPPRSPFVPALLTNLGLLALFAVQHSVMARPAFKRSHPQLIRAAASTKSLHKEPDQSTQRTIHYSPERRGAMKALTPSRS